MGGGEEKMKIPNFDDVDLAITAVAIVALVFGVGLILAKEISAGASVCGTAISTIGVLGAIRVKNGKGDKEE
jgi:hypothetical protein